MTEQEKAVVEAAVEWKKLVENLGWKYPMIKANQDLYDAVNNYLVSQEPQGIEELVVNSALTEEDVVKRVLIAKLNEVIGKVNKLEKEWGAA